MIRRCCRRSSNTCRRLRRAGRLTRRSVALGSLARLRRWGGFKCVVDASRVLASRERQAGQGFRSPACRASESGLDGRIQRVPWLRVAPRARHVGRVQRARLADRRLPPASCRARLRSEPLPTLPRRRVGGLRKTVAVFKRGFGIDGPSRPRRCPRPALWRGAGLDAKWRAAVPALLLVTDDHGAFGAAGSERRCGATLVTAYRARCNTDIAVHDTSTAAFGHKRYSASVRSARRHNARSGPLCDSHAQFS